eukprot:scaffold6786_cov88-Phaeocystis_antarctica.AAC.1
MARREGRARCRVAEQRRVRRLTLWHWVPLEEAPQRLVSIQVPPARRQQQGHALALLHLIVLTWAHNQHRPAALASLAERHIRTRQARRLRPSLSRPKGHLGRPQQPAEARGTAGHPVGLPSR